MANPSRTIPPEYLGTRFRVDRQPATWPPSFVIVTAWATTGEVWSEEANRAADEELARRLGALDVWHHRITGYDPNSDHAEPSWAVEQSLEDAVELAVEFKQLGVFHVVDGELWVRMCRDPRGAAQRVALFFDRLDDFFGRATELASRS